jgi:hypothetical protein
MAMAPMARALVVEDRRGDGCDPHMLLFEGNRVAPGLGEIELLLEFARSTMVLGVKRLSCRDASTCWRIGGIQMGEDRLAGPARIGRRARADAVREADRLRGLALVDVENLVPRRGPPGAPPRR